jgi:hypothetical protein
MGRKYDNRTAEMHVTSAFSWNTAIRERLEHLDVDWRIVLK